MPMKKINRTFQTFAHFNLSSLLQLITSHWSGSTLLCWHPLLLQSSLHHPLHYWMLLQGVCARTKGGIYFKKIRPFWKISGQAAQARCPFFFSELLQGLVEHIWLCHSCRQHCRCHKAAADWISQTLSGGPTHQASQEHLTHYSSFE